MRHSSLATMTGVRTSSSASGQEVRTQPRCVVHSKHLRQGTFEGVAMYRSSGLSQSEIGDGGVQGLYEPSSDITSKKTRVYGLVTRRR